ncbi:MAG: phage terminase small subunit P27 family [Leuconostoc pseudomesenteroides]|uniref:phage terminase small subunit P27 family n=1 Tax=Leuconostoc pseudomesenteroides TaxID=33968 RepID=UPI001E5B7048|nr:phage terminase small subunit P27 family [Leuconostoc pseudomesenteroides]MCC7668932.1 phage terminase small subunit P27 family [Leuconostoc pseudomesenteroides]
MARPAKSIRIQMIEGNTNNKSREEITKRAKAEEKFDVVSSDHMKPPDTLGSDSKKVFRKIVKLMEPVGILNEADIDLIATYADTQVVYTQVMAQLEMEGVVDPETGKPSKFIRERNGLAELLRKLGDKMGLSPQSRAQIANTIAGLANAGKEKVNEWDED